MSRKSWVDPETESRRRWAFFAMTVFSLLALLSGAATIVEQEVAIRRGKYGLGKPTTLRDCDAVTYGSIFTVFGAVGLVISFFYYRDYVKR